MDINNLFDYNKLSEVNNAEFIDMRPSFKFSTLKPNCDTENYTIESDNFLFEIGTLNTMRKTDVFIKIQPDMNFDGIDTKVMHVKGLKVIKDNEVKFDGPWISMIEKEASIFMKNINDLIEDRKKKEQENMQNLLDVFKNYYKE